MSVSSQRFIARHRAPRVQLKYTMDVGGSAEVVQLPFVTGVLADLSGNASAVAKPNIVDRQFMEFDLDNFEARMTALEPAVSMKVANKLGSEAGGDELSAHLKFTKMEDFSPATLARQVPGLAKLCDSRQFLSNVKRYMECKEGARAKMILDDVELVSAIALLGDDGAGDSGIPAEINDRFGNAVVKRIDMAALVNEEFGCRIGGRKIEIDSSVQALARTLREKAHLHGIDMLSLIPTMIEELDDTIGAQLNEILHHCDFQKMEGVWRGLHHLLSRAETDEMLKVRVMNISKTELYRHLRLYPGANWDQSTIFKKVHSEELGQLGGQPYGCLIGDYYFSHLPTDVQLLRDISRIAAATHVPFIAAADPSLLGLDGWQELPNPRHLTKLFGAPEYVAWNALREADDSRYVALAVPRVLARLPYGHRANRIEELHFVEDVRSDDAAKSVDSTKFVWMNSAYVMAANINRAFKRYGWCTRIYGFDGGAAEQLPIYRGATESSICALGPAEIEIDDRRETELANSGLLPLFQERNQYIAAFMSAPSLHKPSKRIDRSITARNQISSTLPFVLASGRFMHYLKCICRDWASSWTHPDEIVRALTDWVKNYVDDNPETSSDLVKAQRPLANVKIVLHESSSNSGQYECQVFIRPRLPVRGASAVDADRLTIAAREQVLGGPERVGSLMVWLERADVAAFD